MTASFKHPAEGLDTAAVAAFESLCINQEPETSKRIIDTLLTAGLVVKIGEKVVGWDRIGAISIPMYAVPYRYHMAWCNWCSSQNKAGGLV